MVGVIGDVELDDFFFLSLFVFFHEREDEAAIGCVCSLYLKFFLTSVNDGLPFAALSAGHNEANAMSRLPTCGVEGAGAHQHTDHIESAIGTCISISGGWFFVALVAHLDLALSVGVGIPYFFLAIGFSLERTFFVVLRNEVEGGIGGECVAHLEDVVGPFGASGNEVGFVGWLSVVCGARDIHRGCARLYPNELPIKIEVVDKCFATAERCVFRRALRLRL